MITVPTTLSNTVGVGAEFHFRQAGGNISFTPASGVTINAPFNGTLTTAGLGSTVTLKCVDSETYDLFGQVGSA